MKNQFLLISLFSVILCSQPFLRNLDDTVTKESCEKEGKKFQEAVPATCKIANYVIEVEKESDCKSGTWDEQEGCLNAPEIENEDDCKGTPTFTPGSQTIPASCKLNGVTISLSEMSEDNCNNAVKWNKASCSTDSTLTETQCKEKKGEWIAASCSSNSTLTETQCNEKKGEWIAASCSPDSTLDETACKEKKGTWTDAHCSTNDTLTQSQCNEPKGTWNDEDGTCSPDSTLQETECKEPKGTWTPGSCNPNTLNETQCNEPKGTWTDAHCSTDDTLTQTQCNEPKGTWNDAYCSISEIKTEEECKNPTYTEEQKIGVCKLGDIVLASRTTEKDCVVALSWGNVKVCSFKEIKDENDCKSKATFAEGTPAKCVESGSNFLKTFSFVFFVICLLF